MDVTAMVPGLTITADGVGNGKGQLDATKITFNPPVDEKIFDKPAK